MNVLQQLLAEQVYVWLVVFARVGSAFMIMPTIGDAFVAQRARLLLGLAVSVLVAPVVQARIPPMPADPFALLLLLVGEITVGVFVASVARLLMSALETAGSIIAVQAGLANAQVFNPAMAGQGSLPGALLGWLGLLLIFLTDMHHLLLMAVVDSFDFFIPGAALPVNDMAATIGRMVSQSFLIGLQMAAPFIVAGILFAFALGLLSKLAPQVQVFFLFTSLQVAVGLFMFALTLSAMMLFWLSHFEQGLIAFLRSS